MNDEYIIDNKIYTGIAPCPMLHAPSDSTPMSNKVK